MEQERPMRKLFLAGRSEAGKTTLIQALKGEEIKYDKTQYVDTWDVIIDTPGEYAESKNISSRALATYSYESDLVGQVVGADEPFSIVPQGLPSALNRPFIGIITKVESPKANLPMVRQWLIEAGCERIFELDSVTGAGLQELKEFLMEPNPPMMSVEEAIRRQRLGVHEWDRE